MHGTSYHPFFMASHSIVFIICIFVISIASCALTSQSKEATDQESFSTSLTNICNVTLHPKECYNSLSPMIVNPNTAVHDSQFFYNISVQVSIDEITKLSNNFSENGTLHRIFANKETLISSQGSCRTMLSLASYNLNLSLPGTSFSTMKSPETRTDFRTRLSATLGDLETCKDAFDYAPKETKSIVIEALDDSTKLVSNSLAIMTKIDSYMGSNVKPETRHKDNQFGPNWLSDEDKNLIYGSKQGVKPDFVVAQDGSGTHSRIGDAVNAVPVNSGKRFVIYVKKGVYNEIVRVNTGKLIMMYGDGMDSTIVSGSLSAGVGRATFDSATFAAFADGFMARDMGFANKAGPKQNQAVALLSTADRSVFYRCKMDGYQDTLFAHTNRQFYRECTILGTIDFIFGYSACVVQSSAILARRPFPGQSNAIVASGRTDPNANTGITVQKCNVSPAEDLSGVRTFLGRPWGDHAITVFMESALGGLIDPKGWDSWDGSGNAPSTILYVEYGNSGPGSGTGSRVPWAGLKVSGTQGLAGRYTVRALINGDQWIPSTGVPFQADL